VAEDALTGLGGAQARVSPPGHRPDRIRVAGITATGHHGVLEHERRDGQTFVADVMLELDTRPAAEQDRLDLTVDYGELSQAIADVITGPPVDLIETLAERIAAIVLEHDAVEAVEVVVHKPQAPLPVPFGDVTVEVRRDRAHPPAVSRRVRTEVRPTTTLADLVVPHLAPEPPPEVAVLVPAAPVASAPVVPTLTPPATPVPAMTRSLDAPTVPAAAVDRDRMDVVPVAPVDVVLALGSNVGASQDTLRDAITALASIEGLEVGAVAPLARTAAVGGPDQPDFLNTVVLGRTVLSPRALLRACQDVEAAFGRVRAERWGPRTLDIDLIVHGATVGVADDLELPHPRAHERAFVLAPWAHVDPAAVLPGLGGGPVSTLAETAPDRDGIRWMALDWWVAEARP
jgi:dihydroneopterin aldolase/2-amino-4-hydroxy-6-hydroxymethyldihydropteridine diphosphokinase